MSNLDVTTDSYNVDKKDWLGHRKGMDTCRSVTLDVSLFTTDHYPNGFIPSGTVLAKKTAGGLYGPYNDALSDGTEVARGHLLNAAQVKDSNGNVATKIAAALLWEGIVIEANLPNFTGTADAKGELNANAKTDLPNIRYE